MDWGVETVPRAARGLRVLLVDCNPAFLLYIAALLEINYYKVTTTEVAAVAISWIVERKLKFDIIIVEVNMPDIDGFVFLEHILRQVDNIPIILMSEDPSGDLANRALQKGASFFFDKPIPNRHIINVWQHYYRVKKCCNSQAENPSDKKGKRKMITEKDDEDHDNSSKKKRDERMKWTSELHLKFVNALAQIGNKKPHPRKIVELMDVPYVKVRHVSSHLQKYRERLKELNGDSSLLIDLTAMQMEAPSYVGVTNASMLPQTRGKSVHLTIDTLRNNMGFMNFNPKITAQYKGKGKQPMEPEMQYGNLNYSGLAITGNVDQDVNISPPAENNSGNMELYELSKILEEDNFEELSKKLVINEDIVTEWGQLLIPT